MGWFSGASNHHRGTEELTAHRFAVVDVETTGFSPATGRVVSLAALALDERGLPERQVVTLLDPGCDPGPTHIHGLTRRHLEGAPRYENVLPQLHELLDGRVLVAHNAAFDHGFLAAEAARAGTTLPTQRRLCTLALSRRLGLDVPNHKLATVAAHWRIPQQRAHDAHDDALVTARVLAHSLQLAGRLALPLPVVDCSGHIAAFGQVRAGYPARVVKAPCPWRDPGRLRPGSRLVQGMKVVITGQTRVPREELYQRLGDAGLEVMSSVSRMTALLVTNDPDVSTKKATRARAEGTPVVDERTLLRLLEAVLPGEAKAAPQAAPPSVRPTQRAPRPAGHLTGHRVLVLGGTHEQAAAVRADVGAAGGAVAVNLSANVTDLFLLDGAEDHPRLARAAAGGVRVHRGPMALGISLPTGGIPAPADTRHIGHAQGSATTAPEAPGQGATEPLVLARGQVIDLPSAAVWTVNAAWRAEALSDGCELDVVAFLLDDQELIATDEDFVFWNAPASEDGAVALSVDGDSEQSVRIDLDLVPAHCARVVVAAALTGDTTFGELGAVAVSVDSDETTAAVTTLDAGTTETVLILTELYRRQDRWRVRAIGQGYDDGLRAMAERFGVDVAD